MPGGLTRAKLRGWLALFFLTLAVPMAVLIFKVYDELRWEAIYRQRLQAEELSGRIDRRFKALIRREGRRSFTDYAFLNVAGDLLQRSPLSAYPVASPVPGLIGYFQVDADGVFTTPLVPADGGTATRYGISQADWRRRLVLAHTLQRILGMNRLVQNEIKSKDKKQKLRSEAKKIIKSKSNKNEISSEEQKKDETPSLKEHAVGRKYAAPALPLPSVATAPPAQEPEAQAAFDRLKKPAQAKKKSRPSSGGLGRVLDLKLDDKFQYRKAEKRTAQADKPLRVRREQNVLPESPPASAPIDAVHRATLSALSKGRTDTTEKDQDQADKIIGGGSKQSVVPKPPAASAPVGLASKAAQSNLSKARVRTFESEIDPFEISLLDSGHFVLFRNVWREGRRYIQGALIRKRPFLNGVIRVEFRATALSETSDLIAAYGGDIITAYRGVEEDAYPFNASKLTGTLLYQTRLSKPLGELEMIFSVRKLPVALGGQLVTWVGLVLLVVLCGGFFMVYRTGLRQIALVEQQQNFVSAVSHELKTPLTSIRMYGEMLREGWAPEDKKQTYYGFIHDESDRLSRLISNVLQIARMTRNDLQPDLKRLTVSQLIDELRSKIASQVERAGFTLNLRCEESVGTTLLNVDADFFAQIMINLVDNATKFARKADNKTIDITCARHSDGTVVVTVRDYGPGIPKDQMKKIFKLFYRTGTELTRETAGTGIGLALVRQLAAAMNAEIDAVNKDPGVAFSLRMFGV